MEGRKGKTKGERPREGGREERGREKLVKVLNVSLERCIAKRCFTLPKYCVCVYKHVNYTLNN